jgi:3-oxoadipate enol-lactonase
MLDVLVYGGPAGVADEMLSTLLGQTTRERRPELMADIRRMIKAQSRPAIASALKALMSRPDSTPTLEEIRVPTLIVVGEEDTLTPPPESERMQASIPGALLERIPEAGHMANLENPDAFNAAVRRFLMGLRS